MSTDKNQFNTVSEETLSLLKRNFEMSVDERIDQLQSAVDLIEEMNTALSNEKESK
jgi:hypothetical protein